MRRAESEEKTDESAQVQVSIGLNECRPQILLQTPPLPNCTEGPGLSSKKNTTAFHTVACVSVIPGGAVPEYYLSLATYCNIVPPWQAGSCSWGEARIYHYG